MQNKTYSQITFEGLNMSASPCADSKTLLAEMKSLVERKLMHIKCVGMFDGAHVKITVAISGEPERVFRVDCAGYRSGTCADENEPFVFIDEIVDYIKSKTVEEL